MAEDYISQFYTWATGNTITAARLNGNLSNIIDGLSGGAKAINLGKVLVNGTAVIDLARTVTATALTVSGDATFDTTTLKVDSTNNRVGIGTATPTTTLQVVGTVTATTIIGAFNGTIITGTYGGTGINNGSNTLTLGTSVTITSAAATVLDDATVAAMVDTLGGASSTGTGGLARATSPTFVTPILGTPTSGTLTNCTSLPVSTGISGLATGIATFLATPTSANLIAAMTDETGTGANVFATSPTLVTPLLGTPTSGVLTNCTGLPLTTGITGTLGVANGGTGTTTAFTTGSVVFAGSSGVYSQDNSNFFWDDTNNRLGIGKSSPTKTLDVSGTALISANTGADLLTLTQTGSSGSWLGFNPYSASNGATIYTNWTTGSGSLSFGVGSASPKMTILDTGQVGIGTSSPNTVSILDLTSTTKGLLLPRMTTVQRDAISGPPSGLVIYNSTTGKINVRGAAAWEAVTSV